ncbi:MarC family protein [Gilvimarinus sp. F26214L]|uniref:MarC family protein n=1 Tax=Gilvimarinus sp. DZF01 TaxID=3461371 RepID=UPI004045B979
MLELALPLTEYSKFLIAMIAIVDPLMILPIYVRITARLSRTENKRLARQVAFATTTALLISLFLGEDILRFFGISLPSFRIAGGLLLLVMGMQMIYESTTSERTADSEMGQGVKTQVVVPIAIPLLAGPGAFSTVIVFSFRSNLWEHYALMMGCLLIIGSIIWISLRMGGKLLRKVGPTAIAISNKVMGLIIVAIAVEFIAVGIKQFVAG